ncbi:MAG: hypothetical protein AMJ90_07670 [candidate division Zixibacteria bacterium SM23_73_2]|nr:MAG: hypothetical protein AMJ90_07670 [candidate division Zixibacteria bacterium SM23_73_2]
MAKKSILFTVFLSVFLTAYSQADDSRVGTTAYNFLKIGVGARSQAMGSAFVGLADDETALFFNPSGIVQNDKRSFSISYNNYLTDIQSGFLGYIHPYSEKINFGAYISYFNYGSFDEVDKEGNNLGTFGAGDLSLGLAYAQRFGEYLNLGTCFKVVYGTIKDYSSDAIAVDLGGLFKLKDNRTRMGFSLRNLGIQLKGYTESHTDPLPTIFEVGFSHSLRGLPLLFTVDTAKPFDNDIFFDLGGELYALKPLILRAGWSSFGDNFKTDSDGDNWAGLTLGFGVLWKVYRFDYAFSSYADLGGVHRISVSGTL